MIVIKTQIIWSRPPTYFENDQDKKQFNKLGLSCAKLSLASAKLYASLSSDQLKLAANYTY